MKNQKRIRTKGIALAMFAAGICLLAGCGGGDKEGNAAEANFTYLLSTGEDTYHYEEYEDGPIAKYWLDKEWDADGDGNAVKVSIDFISPPKGAEKDNLTTLLSTGEYPDIFDTSYSSQRAAQLYEDGIALDLTEYVEKYMPNYLAWIDAHPEYANRITNLVDGERRYLQIYDLADIPGEPWGGYCYRRDWIVRYGKNPVTGAAFSGEWIDGEWIDDVVFPSGERDPFYISDWEWMLDIFAAALDDQGVTDGYPMSLYYVGYLGTGDFTSGFGFGGGGWYIDEDGNAAFGGTDDGFRAYLECMNTWYGNGWIDKAFAERSNDLFFMIDTASVYSGKVGAWYGQLGSLGDALDSKSGDASDLLNGAVICGAPQPINDVYGSDAQKNKIPYCYYAGSVVGPSIVVTDKAKDKDLASFFTALDYLYSTEGSLLRYYGFSDVQQEQVQDAFYKEHGLDHGAYTVLGTEGEPIYHIAPEVTNDATDMDTAIKLLRVVGLATNVGRDNGYSAMKQHSVDLWRYYEERGSIGNEIMAQLTKDETKSTSSIATYVSTYMSQAVPEFIMGGADVRNDEDWNTYCRKLEKYEPESYTAAVQRVLKGE